MQFDPTTVARLDIPATLSLDRPTMCIVVDTEEEFDWSAPFDRDARGTLTAANQELAHEIFDPLGIKPMYVMDQAIVDCDTASSFFEKLKTEDRCEIGAHLHPWLTPPYEEEVNNHNSYQGNLPKNLEFAKVRHLKDSIQERFGDAPITFKAGRYGLGKNSFSILKELGFKIDCSVVPHTNYSAVEGPDFRHMKASPFWTDTDHSLLELPLTRGYTGWGRNMGDMLRFIFDTPKISAFRIPGILSRSGMLKRITLTPEGIRAKDQKALLRAEVTRGRQFFSLAYHSSSLGVGYTSYVQSKEDLKAFLDNLKEVLIFFQNELGGQFLAVTDIYRNAQEAIPQKRNNI